MVKQKAGKIPAMKKAERKLGGYGKNVQKCQKNSQSNRSGCPACGGRGPGSWTQDSGFWILESVSCVWNCDGDTGQRTHTKCWPAGGDGSSINDGFLTSGLGPDLGFHFPMWNG
uniref:HDC08015 n=1 Tax=Drosophila melanogaster TaxID=7227 RepID=Q6ILZ6_DROME|nr:TPA_inf: HDC08015 [Drosophila melanogaster]